MFSTLWDGQAGLSEVLLLIAFGAFVGATAFTFRANDLVRCLLSVGLALVALAFVVL